MNQLNSQIVTCTTNYTAYADDSCILTGDLSTLLKQITLLEKFHLLVGLSSNTAKCCFIVFNSKHNNYTIQINGSTLDIAPKVEIHCH